MRYLELLAPARNKEIGIAAINCGADAVYIAGPSFGARKAAGNEFGDIRELCEYAHKFGARIFVTYNTIIRDDEMEEAHSQMLQAQEAGADAFIIRDARIAGWEDIHIPLHASTQCAIRTPERARYYVDAGCSRIILERELSLEQIKAICSAVDCEVEFFVHGALCVCYSGDCRLSEFIDGRSADKGECIQACRSLYDLVDGDGNVLVKKKALLSLKDYNLKARLEDLAEAGISSFKIEGRLKNASYVKNVVRDYSLALDALVAKYPDRYARASFGVIDGGFAPDSSKTFNRGYTELYLDGKRGQWSSMDAPKSMGEAVGEINKISQKGNRTLELRIQPASRSVVLHNGDGFAFSTRDGVVGFRGDVCEGLRITCKEIPELRTGIKLFRNINSNFEKTLENQVCRREIPVKVDLTIHGKYVLELHALTADGREFVSTFNTDVDTAENRERAEAMLREQLSKRSGHYNFSLDSIEVKTAGGKLPLLSAGTINSMRRLLAEDLDTIPFKAIPLSMGERKIEADGTEGGKPVIERELMRTRYCLRYELGMCPKHQNGRPPKDLFIINNGRRFRLGFDCARCEMTVEAL